MKKLIFSVIIFLSFTSIVFAHSGRTDSCGGHNDRKRGGYHVHNYSKYCACYPNDSICNKDRDSSKQGETNKSKIKKK